jgi:hemerythrin-like metal-binding protein
MVNYLSKHFYDEELVMMKVNYHDYKKHVEEHQKFTEKVEDFLKAYRNKEENLTLEMVSFLRDWVLSHTTGSDLKYRALVLKSQR